jgi:hypothetical protein
MGALLPKDLTNLIAACKNIGATHLTSGAYRVHPVEWAIGEAAGILAAYCVAEGVTPKGAWRDSTRLLAVQRRLLYYGAPIFWWEDVQFEDDAEAFVAVQLLSTRGIFEPGKSLKFNPNDPISDDERLAINDRAGRVLPWPQTKITRARAAVWVAQQLGYYERPLQRPNTAL